MNPKQHFNPHQPANNYVLRGYQQRIKQHMIDTPCCFVDAGMSTGKTLCAIDYAMQIGGIVIVIYPAAVRASWHEDVRKFNINYNVVYLNDTARQNTETLKYMRDTGYEGIIGMSYAMARSLYSNYRSTRYKDIGFDLSTLNPSAVVVDEGHKLGGYNTKQTLYLTDMFKDTPRKVIMSGTLYSDNLEKLWSTSRFLFPHFVKGKRHPQNKLVGMGATRDQFVYNYYNWYKHGYRPPIPTKPKDNTFKLLSDILKPYTITIKTADVAELPQVNTDIIEIPLPAKTKKQYDSLAKDYVLTYSDDSVVMTDNALTSLIALQRLACTGMLEDIDNKATYFDIKPRLDYVKEYINGLGDKPLVIFHRFKRDYTLITDILNKLGIDYASLNGSVKDMERFTSGEVRVIVVNVGSGSVGIRLNKCGDEYVQHILYYSFNWSNADYQQGISRVVRSDNDAIKVFATVLLTSGIERYMFNRLINKQNDQQVMENFMK